MHLLKQPKIPLTIAYLHIPSVHLPEKQQNNSKSSAIVDENEVLKVQFIFQQMQKHTFLPFLFLFSLLVLVVIF